MTTIVASGNPLRDRLELERGRIAAGGVQALVRLLLDQRRADARRGWRTAGLVSGYRGSPLGGLDQQLQREAALLDAHDIRFVPGVNEELAATVVYGSQLAGHLPGPRHEGVFGLWYGKAPGVDRSMDAFKHANWLGTAERGGVLAVVGDDPSCKSSTLPSATEGALAEAFMPVLVPASVGDVLRLGRAGFEMSRFSGAWVGLKVVTDVADSHEVLDVAPVPDHIVPGFEWRGRPWRPTRRPGVDLKDTTSLEPEVLDGRLRAATAFAAANGLDRIEGAADAALGLVAAGRTYLELREALDRLGLDEDALARRGVRLLRLALVHPLDRDRIREFADGLREIVVVEEKRAFVETQIRDVLYDAAERPAVLGKHGPDGAPLIPADGGLDADRITRALARLLADRIGEEHLDLRDPVLRPRKPALNLVSAARTPFFCSGCPHNRSTVVPDGSVAASGIGCHVMTVFNDRSIGTTQMGGEGAMWVGAAPFSDTAHMFQNLGDGTFFHSGGLAVRQAVAAGTNITFKLLYNAAVAMTGGQDADGGADPAAVTRMLHAEGVARIVVVADDPSRYPRGTHWAPGVRVRHRDDLDAVQRELREVPGVTVLLYDQACAAETRRKRKRGQAPDPAARVLINEAVCEGCGDCGTASNCLSVEPVETEFGRKTRIDQTSCNKDYSCLHGDCPSFLTVVPGGRAAAAPMLAPIGPQPEPAARPVSADVLLVGIGGTGVVTVNQVLATAALLDGRHARALDQTGLSQKAGAVVSHLRIGDADRDRPGMVGAGGADAYLVFDSLAGTAEANLRRCAPARTAAVVSTSEVPTGRMITDTSAALPPGASLVRRIADRTDAARLVALDALGLAERWFGGTTTANFVVVGAAYQSGLLPLSATAIEEALALNGVQVEANVQAFRAGRRLVLDPGFADGASVEAAPADDAQTAADRPLDATAPAALGLVAASGADGELLRVLRIRVPDLAAYQDLTLARRYLDAVARVADAERAAGVPGQRLAVAVARNLYKLMAYKDEYEVARLHLDPALARHVEERFGPGSTVRYMLHPPVLKALGLQRKIALGRTARPAFRALRAMRRLRGTPLDPFGATAQRRAERRLVAEYGAVVAELVAGLDGDRHDLAVRIAELPDMIRGYEDVKTAAIARYREEQRALLASWRAAPHPRDTGTDRDTGTGRDAEGDAGRAGAMT
ncbi:indolepyruvate ferredoxin oxidoreductase family protein [Actinomadura graeca]|uniref:Indolepyruvate ferredoxin oxidoreductase family protein n=1 Tax=Actinomadura graeca TaxID=2750812 RepID=A0ABX8R197_9ACTN|nr:indolepyruvate ferredoxin oxidoreductase family protein [Actinomadura graeca]QXJ24326.1 indolepyruvate ferredoxin oxidoreductase family protein [Actinomadura graeca]